MIIPDDSESQDSAYQSITSEGWICPINLASTIGRIVEVDVIISSSIYLRK